VTLKLTCIIMYNVNFNIKQILIIINVDIVKNKLVLYKLFMF